jgi:RNA binding exosome subunit
MPSLSELKIVGGSLLIIGAVVFGYIKGYDKGAAKLAALTVERDQIAASLQTCRDNNGSLTVVLDKQNAEIQAMSANVDRINKDAAAKIVAAKKKQAELEKIIKSELNKPMPEDKTQWIKNIAQSIALQMEGLR